jgi:hypothetical protein
MFAIDGPFTVQYSIEQKEESTCKISNEIEFRKVVEANTSFHVCPVQSEAGIDYANGMWQFNCRNGSEIQVSTPPPSSNTSQYVEIDVL